MLPKTGGTAQRGQIVLAVIGAVLIAGCRSQDRGVVASDAQVFAELSSGDRDTVVCAIHNGDKKLSSSTARRDFRKKLDELLHDSDPQVVRAAITQPVLSKYSEVRIVDTPEGEASIRAAIDRYNKVVDNEKISLSRENGKPLLLFRNRIR